MLTRAESQRRLRNEHRERLAPGLNDGVRLLAQPERGAVHLVAEIFAPEEARLKAAPDSFGDLASRGAFLFGKGYRLPASAGQARRTGSRASPGGRSAPPLQGGFAAPHSQAFFARLMKMPARRRCLCDPGAGGWCCKRGLNSQSKSNI